MLTIADVLKPTQIDLDVKATNPEEAVFQVADLLQGDDRVLDRTKFYDALKAKTACVAEGDGFQVWIPHARTQWVSTMVMSVGVSRGADCINYIFVIGVPVPLAADYLRIIGALARIFRASGSEKALREIKTPDEFLAVLCSKEMNL